MISSFRFVSGAVIAWPHPFVLVQFILCATPSPAPGDKAEPTVARAPLRQRVMRKATLAVLLFALPWSMASPCAAQDRQSLPRLHTDEQYVTDVTKQSGLDVTNVKAVLKFVLSQLPDRVRVFPTENYYYFYFYYGGIKYAGNFRFDVDERDKGLVKFIYFKDSTDLITDEHDYRAVLGEKDGVVLTKVEDLVYRLDYDGESVTFALNDLSDVRPPEGMLNADETFLGPVFDESGIRFFLIFNEDLKIFYYVLDETVPVADELVALPGWKHVVVGRRTSFAFFLDPTQDRKLLVGVYEPNINVNSYLDGPFDQLPDNFLKGNELRRALLLARPGLDPSSIDRLGIYPDNREFREEIAPYGEYLNLPELAPVEECATRGDRDAIYLCLQDFDPSAETEN
jgi:hypothetical protein